MPLPRFARRVVLIALVAVAVLAPAPAKATDAPPPAPPADPVAAADAPAPREEWAWPLTPFRLTRAYAAPAHRYGAGHRGIDLAPGGSPVGSPEVRAPAAGVIAFAGSVAERGIVTIDHGDGLVTTLEPVVTELVPGTAVARGDVVGSIDSGGHAEPGTVHFGVRLGGEYVNPMLLLGGVPRAVLLPCC